MKLNQRMGPEEADQRAIIDKHALFSTQDYEEHTRAKKAASAQLKSKMDTSLAQRSDQREIVQRGIVPREYLDDDANVAKAALDAQRSTVKSQISAFVGDRPDRHDPKVQQVSRFVEEVSDPVPLYEQT